MKKKEEIEDLSFMTYRPVSRPVVAVSHRDIDLTIETVQGKSHTVAELYKNYVMGTLDQSMIGGDPVYDSDDSEEVDPFNSFGLTLEEASVIADRGKQAGNEIRESRAAKQKADQEKIKSDQEAALRKKIEEELKASREDKDS